jgi:Flp pilus assembly protein TadD
LTWLPVLLAGATALALAVSPVWDYDVWFQLACGRAILALKSLPATDLFSFTAADRPWDTQEWLSQALFYGTWKFAGIGGLTALKALIAGLTFLVIARRAARAGGTRASGWIALLVCAGAAWIMRWHTVERPQIFSYLFLALMLARLRSGGPTGWFVPLTVLWANLHGGAALLAPGILALWYGGRLLDGLRGVVKAPPLRPVAVLFACMTAAIMINPAGYRLYIYPFETMRDPMYMANIREWMPPSFDESPEFLCFLGLTVAAVALGHRAVSAGDLAMTAAFAVLALSARRHIPLFLVTAAPVLTRILAGAFGRLKTGLLPAALLGLAGPVLFLTLAYQRGEGVRTGFRADLYPVGAVGVLREAAVTDQRSPSPYRIYALHRWGGFLEWNLPATFKVFIDGRQLVYGPRLFVDYYKIMEDEPETGILLGKYRPDIFILDYGSKLGRRLAAGAGGRETALVHWDDSCLVYVNRNRFPELVRKHGYRAYNPESGPAGSLPAVLAELGRAAAESPRHARPHALAASLLLSRGRLSEADREATDAIRLAPRNPSVLLVGFDAALAVHDLGRARELARRALRADPGSCAVLLAGVRLASAENRAADAEKAVTAAIRVGEAWREKFRTPDPALGDAYRLKAGLLSAAGNAPGAADSLRTAGNTYYDLGRTTDALACYEAGLKLAPGDARLLHNRGTVSVATGRIPEAIADFTRALAREPGNARMHVSLGVALWKAGRKDSARAAWARALELDPANADALTYLTQAK